MPAEYVMLECQVEGIAAEVYLNDIPVSLLDPDKSSRETRPVNQYLIDGKNELSVVINPGLIPSQAKTGSANIKVPRLVGLRVRLAVYPKGALPGRTTGRELAALNWSLAAGESFVAPLSIATTVDLGRLYGQWAWQSAPILDLTHALASAADDLLRGLALAFSRGNADPFIQLARLRFEDNARAYSLAVQERIERYRADVAGLAAKPGWKMVTADRAAYDLRLCAGGKMVDCIAKDWLPILRGMPDDEGNFTVRYPLLVAQIGGRLQIVR